MNKFDEQYNKILLEQNLIDENAFIDSLKWVGGKLTSAGKTIVDLGKNTINYTINGIKSFFEKLWDLLTPDNAEQSAKTAKSFVQKIPGDLGNTLKKGIALSENPQYKQYITDKIQTTYGQKYSTLSDKQKKDFVDKCSQDYIKNNDIITQAIISEQPITITICIIAIIAAICGGGWFLKDTFAPSDARKAVQDAKNQTDAAEIRRENELAKVQQKKMTAAQQEQLFTLIAGSSYFN